MTTYRYEPLPKKLFLVRVPIVATYTDAEIEFLGLPITINHQQDYGANYGDCNYQAYKELTTVMLPLTKIIDIYCNGHKIAVVKKSDIPIIYGILEKYLLGVTAVKQFSLNHAMIEEDRMDDIERFAQEMFGINKAVIAKSVFDQMNQNPFNLNSGFMTPVEAYNAKQKAIQSQKQTIPVVKKFTAKKPLSHLSYPYTPEQQVNTPATMSVDNTSNTQLNYVQPEDLSSPAQKNISYIYQEFPEFDLSKVSRTPTNSFRKVYNT